jgi:hypothetical protein
MQEHVTRHVCEFRERENAILPHVPKPDWLRPTLLRGGINARRWGTDAWAGIMMKEDRRAVGQGSARFVGLCRKGKRGKG